MNEKEIINEGKRVIGVERLALKQLEENLDDGFARAVHSIFKCKGKIVTSGMGKAGIIAGKVATTLSSLGSSSFFMHPAEAVHGDLGMVSSQDVIVLFSNSGESKEIRELIPSLKMIKSEIIAITGNPESTLGKESSICLSIGQLEEACAMGLAPTTTTTAMLALGDALSVSVMRLNEKFNEKNFAFFHPGGSLGKRLMKVEDLMHTSEPCLTLPPGTKVQDALFSITHARAGAAMIVDESNQLLGIFTDGDLRRQLERGADVLDQTINNLMTRNPKCIDVGSFAMEAVKIFKEFPIKDLPVVDKAGKVRGILVHRDFFEVGLL